MTAHICYLIVSGYVSPSLKNQNVLSIQSKKGTIEETYVQSLQIKMLHFLGH